MTGPAVLESSGRSRTLAVVAVWVAACLALVGAFLIAGEGPHASAIGRALVHGDVDALRSQFGSIGAWAAVAIVLAALAHTAVPYPAELLAAASGFALGFWLAVPVVLLGLMLSAIVAYQIGIWVGHPVVARLVGPERLTRVETRVAAGGPRPLLVLRLIPLVPFSPVCFACGIVRVPRRRFLWTTALGILPEVAVVTYLGARLQSVSLSGPSVWGPLAGIVLLLIVVPTMIERSRHRARRSQPRAENMEDMSFIQIGKPDHGRHARSLWIAAAVVAATLAAVLVVFGHVTGFTSPGSSHHRGSHAGAVAKTSSHDPLATSSGVALGVNTDGAPTAGLDQFTALAGIKPKIDMWYQGWDAPLLYPSQVRAVASLGVVPMITWDPTFHGKGIPLLDIAEGKLDSYVRTSAEAARAWGQPIYIRFAHEMNLGGEPYGPGHDGNTPHMFVSAWRHVESIFKQVGASNVQFVWSPNVDCNGGCPFTAFYPGDQYVDWVSLDGYNYGNVNGDPWATFQQVFGPSYAILTHMTSKPVMISETSSGESGGSKAAWIKGIGHTLDSDFKRVRVLVWFQRVKETDWRVNSSASALSAFRDLMRQRPFRTG
ncbi:MAG TPA: VTT domain-containing protein [Solirubrobacteraceae bacterium]